MEERNAFNRLPGTFEAPWPQDLCFEFKSPRLEVEVQSVVTLVDLLYTFEDVEADKLKKSQITGTPARILWRVLPLSIAYTSLHSVILTHFKICVIKWLLTIYLSRISFFVRIAFIKVVNMISPKLIFEYFSHIRIFFRFFSDLQIFGTSRKLRLVSDRHQICSIRIGANIQNHS